MDLFLPSVPVIAQSFGAEPGVAQHAITTYLLGLAIGQLAWGPVSDRYGRKPALLAGAFDGTTRPMALAIAGFGVAALLAERLYFRKMVHG